MDSGDNILDLYNFCKIKMQAILLTAVWRNTGQQFFGFC